MPFFWQYQMCFKTETKGVTPAQIVRAGKWWIGRIHTDASTDKYGSLVIKHVSCRSTIGAVDAELRERTREGGDKVTVGSTMPCLHPLDTPDGGVCDFGHDRAATSETLAESMGPVTDLTDVYGDIGITGSGRDGELEGDERDVEKMGKADRMPLEGGNVRDLDKEPLAGCVLEAWFYDAELHDATWVNEDV